MRRKSITIEEALEVINAIEVVANMEFIELEEYREGMLQAMKTLRQMLNLEKKEEN
jgi:hypothetical protein